MHLIEKIKTDKASITHDIVPLVDPETPSFIGFCKPLHF
jgi:hypothetical protein